MMIMQDGSVGLEAWSPGDIDILERCNTPEAKRYIGGPETPEKLLDRHRRYLEGARPGGTRMFRVSHDGRGAGSAIGKGNGSTVSSMRQAGRWFLICRATALPERRRHS